MVSLWLFLLFQLFSCGLQWFSFDFNGFSMVVFVFQWLFSLGFCLFSLIKSLGGRGGKAPREEKGKGQGGNRGGQASRGKGKAKGGVECLLRLIILTTLRYTYV